MPLLTINLQVENKPCLVVGGGNIALQKIGRLVEAGAQVTVVAPKAKALPQEVTFLQREAQESDLDGVFLAMFATDDKQLNRRFYHLAKQRGILAMAVDDLEAADFFSPAILRRGDLEVAVSTAGKGPAFSAHIRNLIGEQIDESYGEALAWLAEFRTLYMQDMDMKTRIACFRELLASDYIAHFRSGHLDAWEVQAQEILAKHQTLVTK